MTQEEYQGKLNHLLEKRQELISSITLDAEESKAQIRERQKKAADERLQVQRSLEADISKIKAERETKRRAKETELSKVRSQIADLKYQMFTIKNND